MDETLYLHLELETALLAALPTIELQNEEWDLESSTQLYFDMCNNFATWLAENP